MLNRKKWKTRRDVTELANAMFNYIESHPNPQQSPLTAVTGCCRSARECRKPVLVCEVPAWVSTPRVDGAEYATCCRAVGISFSARQTRSTMKRVNVSDHDPGSPTAVIGSRAPDCSLWGKLNGPDGLYPLLCHLLDTSAAALVIWDRWLRPGLKDLITAAISADDLTAGQRAYAVIAGLHDVGKASKVFQGQQLISKRPSAIAAVLGELGKAGYDITPPRSDIAGVRIPDVYGTVLRRHEALSLFVTSGAWPDGEQQIGDNWAGTVVGGHHGRFHPRFDGESKPADTDTADNYLRQLVEAGWGIQQHCHVTG